MQPLRVSFGIPFIWATTPSQSGPGSTRNKRVLCSHQSSSITGASLSDCWMSYLGYSLGETCPTAEKLSVYSTPPADWVMMEGLLVLAVNLIQPSEPNQRQVSVKFFIFIQFNIFISQFNSFGTKFLNPFIETFLRCRLKLQIYKKQNKIKKNSKTKKLALTDDGFSLLTTNISTSFIIWMI